MHSEDDAASLHVAPADEARALAGRGAAAYLDIDGVIAAAEAARLRRDPSGLRLPQRERRLRRGAAPRPASPSSGPTPERSTLFGDKARARALAERVRRAGACRARPAPTTLDEARGASSPPSAPAGRSCSRRSPAAAGAACARATTPTSSTRRSRAAAPRPRRPSATATSTSSAVRTRPPRRGADRRRRPGAVEPSWRARCSIQRRHQKLVEIAPARLADGAARAAHEAAVRDGRARSATAASAPSSSWSTTTRSTDGALRLHRGQPAPAGRAHGDRGGHGLDLVQPQLALAGGAHAGRPRARRRPTCPAPRGFAIQCRVNMETMARRRRGAAAGGTLTRFEPPSGPGVRVDTSATPATAPAPRFDSLLAKLIVHSPSASLADAVAQGRRGRWASSGSRASPTNIRVPAGDPAPSRRRRRDGVTPRFVEEHVAELVAAAAAAAALLRRRRRRDPAPATRQPRRAGRRRRPARGARLRRRPAARAVAAAGRAPTARCAACRRRCRARSSASTSREGDPVRAGQQLAGAWKR